MKSLLIAAILLISTPAFAGNVIEGADTCTFYAAKASEYSVYALLSGKDEKLYIDTVTADIDTARSSAMKKWLTDIAELSWEARGKDKPAAVAMAVYEVCMKKSGLST